MKTLRVKLTFIKSVLGTCPNNADLYREFIGSKAPDAERVEDEVAALGVDAVAEKGTTIFPRDSKGRPFLWAYQVKGFFKGSAGHMNTNDPNSKLTAYKKKIDGGLFVWASHVEEGNELDMIPFENYGDITLLQRPLRAQTMQGERVSLACSEEIQKGASITFDVECENEALVPYVKKWLDFGLRNGIGQWRNSWHGAFRWELLGEWDGPAEVLRSA